MNLYEESLKVCVVDENDRIFFKTLEIIGSPTYLIFVRGREIKRILGVQDYETLLSFVSGILQDYQK